MVWVEEADEEEGHVVLPRYSSEAAQVGYSDYIMVSIVRITDLHFLEICLIVHIPAEDNRAEAESIFCDSKELLLGHELAAKDAINVNTGDFDLGIVSQDILQRIVRDLADSPIVAHLDVKAR